MRSFQMPFGWCMTKNPCSSNPANRPQKSRAKWRHAIPLILILVALITPLIGKKFSTDSAPQTSSKVGPTTVDWSQSSAEVRKSLEEAKSQAAEAEAKLWANLGACLEEMQKSNKKASAASVDAAVRKFEQVDEIGLLIVDFAQDKVRGGDRAMKRVEADSTSFTRALRDSSVRTREMFNAFQQDLAAINNYYAIAVGEIIDEQESILPPSNFEHLVRLRTTIPSNVTLEVGSAGVAVAFEIYLIRATKKAIKNLYRYFAKKLAPQIAKVAVGAGAAAADGPLPIGDILTVGLAIWTVYDVATLPEAIRNDVRKEFKNAADEHHRLLDEQLTTAVVELSHRSSEAREKLHQDLLTALP